MTNLVFVIASDGRTSGGMEKQCALQANALCATKPYHVHVLAHPSYQHLFEPKVQFHALPFELGRRDPRLRRKLRCTLDSIHADIIHTHGNKAFALVAATKPSIQSTACKHVTTIHGLKKPSDLYQHCDRIIAVSQGVADAIRPFESQVIHNAVTLLKDQDVKAKAEVCKEFSLSPEKPLLMAAGRLVKVKGYDHLMSACRELNCCLVIFGEGPELNDLKRLETSNVRLAGYRDNIQAYLSAADALLIASEKEGFGLTMIEALQLQTPVLSTPIPLATELLPKQCLLPRLSERPSSTSQMALKQALSDQLKALKQIDESLAPVYQRAITRFSVEALVEALSSCYQGLVTDNPHLNDTTALSSAPHYLFLGDCNTLGTPAIEGQAYPEALEALANVKTLNCGHTMSTVREGGEYFRDFHDANTALVSIQYGLVDSWRTFKYSPYALYYPDSAKRKLARKLIKKYKKWCKKLGLNRLIGTRNVVPIKEYEERITAIIKAMKLRPVILIETVPNKDTSRNSEIQRYNRALATLAKKHDNCHLLSLYDDFCNGQKDLYCDPTHLSQEGHQYVAKKLCTLINTLNQ